MTMGPPQAKDVLLECFFVGADRAVHLVDRAFAGADTLATARALALAIKQAPYDLIICGKHSVDAETGQVGPEVAELLDIPHVTGVFRLSFDCPPGYFIAERETDEGFETIQCKLPALITAAERLVRPVKVKPPDLETVKDKPIEIVTAQDLSKDTSIFGQAGSPTWVSEIIALEHNRQVEILSGKVEEMAEALLDRLCARGLFCGWGQEAEAKPECSFDQVVQPIEGRNVLAVCEIAGGQLRDVSYELVGKGKELACQLGGEVAAVLIGENLARHSESLAAYGADRVYLIEGERFTTYNPADYAAAVAEAIEQLRPYAVLIPSTSQGRDYAPRVAARLGLGLTADCIDLGLNEQNLLIQYKPAFGGQIVAPIFSNTFPQMATVRPGMLASLAPEWSRSCPVEIINVNHSRDDRYRVLSKSEAAAEASRGLDDPEIVVCVGMGIGGPENLSVVDALAQRLGGAIGATRKVVDSGWLPSQLQIGTTGRAVAPKLYIGVGVRGVFNHSIGIKRSGIIVAINTDAQAEIFQVADYGIVADYAEFVPALIAALDRRKIALAAASPDQFTTGPTGD
jgi:electron transfer flavoprotein alpha subunit